MWPSGAVLCGGDDEVGGGWGGDWVGRGVPVSAFRGCELVAGRGGGIGEWERGGGRPHVAMHAPRGDDDGLVVV